MAGKSVRMLSKGQKLAVGKILSADWLKVAQLIKYSASQAGLLVYRHSIATGDSKRTNK